ncbi:MAG: hypothetical protein ABJL33_15375 [Hyphomicrobiales bacterium]
MNHVELMDAYCDYRSQLRNEGFGIRPVLNFDEVIDVISDFEKIEITPRLSPLQNDFTTENSFWLLLEVDGNAIGGVCARVDELRGEPFNEYLIRTARRHYGEKGVVEVPDFLAENRYNTVAYIGEFFKKREYRGDVAASELFLKCAFCVLFLKWRPDWMYAFLRSHEVQKNACNRYGFSTQIPNAQTWLNPPHGRSSDEWLVGMTAAEFSHMVSCRSLYPVKPHRREGDSRS